MEKKIGIVIVICNKQDLVEKCLSSLKKNTDYKKYKVYISDNSEKGSLGKEIKKKFKWINLIINGGNLGFPKAANIGMKKAIEDYNPDYLLLLNDDMEFIEKDWLKKMMSVAETNKDIGMLGCKLIYPDRRLQWFYKNGKMHFEQTKKSHPETKETFKIKEVDDIFGACWLIKREVIDEIGLMDEKFSPLYGEDTDLCYRASKRGYKLVYVGNTKIIHYGSASQKKLEPGGGKWFLQKKHAIRLEWLNFNFTKIIKYSIIHFGSAILSKNPAEGLVLLTKAYKENLEDFREIRRKRIERFSWKK